jgi:hypothetical protein
LQNLVYSALPNRWCRRSKEGLQKTKDKVEAVVNTPVPKNTTQLRALLGLVNYYHKILPNLATEIRPLNELLEKDSIQFQAPPCQFVHNSALISLKNVMQMSRAFLFCLSLPVNYYHKFLPNLATEIRPLNELLEDRK